MNETTSKKWTGKIGPRQAKAVNSATSSVLWEGKTRVELSGVVGEKEHRAVLTEMFGKVRAEALDGLADIGERYEWTLTRENYKRVVSEMDTLKRRLEESRPIVDCQRTADEEAERIDRQRAGDQDHAIEARAKAAEYQKILGELREQYPWARQDGSNHARASANIKRELQQAFLGIRFTVRSDSFSGGDSVDVGWEDGPTSKEVDAIVGKYQKGSFDGMQDLYEYDHSAYSDAVGTWLGSANYVQSQRETSEAVTFEIARLLCEKEGIEYRQPEHTWELRNVLGLYGPNDGEDLLTHVWRVVQFASFPAAFEIVGLERDEAGGHLEPYALTLKAPERAANL